MKINRTCFISAICFIFLFTLLCLPLTSYSYKLVYTIQTASFISSDAAESKYNSIVRALKSHQLDNLRIEKIGKYYAVRLGKFDDQAAANEFLKTIQSVHPTPIVMDAYIKSERLIKVYELPPKEIKQTIEVPSPNLPAKPQKLIAESIQEVSKTSATESIAQIEEAPPADITEEPTKHGTIEKAETQPAPTPSPVKIGLIVTAKPKKKIVLDNTLSTKEQPANNSLQKKPIVKTPLEAVKKTKQKKVQHAALPKPSAIPSQKIKGPPSSIKHRKKLRPNHERKGDMYLKGKRYFLALDEYRQSKHKRPILRSKLAALNYQMGFVREAITELEKAVESSPHKTDLRKRLGMYYFALNKTDKAKEQFFTALKINPGSTHVYYYLGEVFLKTGEHDMAWMSVTMAKRLGYKGEDLIHRLKAVSKEPDVRPWDTGADELYIRLILADTHESAEIILLKISEGELFEDIARKESRGTGASAGGYMGHLTPEETDQRITDALMKQDVLSAPIIIETEKGFHIAQRIIPFSLSTWEELLPGPDNARAVSEKAAQ